MTLEELDRARVVREAFRTVLDPRRPETATVLGSILDQAGYYSMNPETVRPELVALCNWLLGQIGVIHPLNVYNYSVAILSCANDDDIVAERRKIVEGGEDE